MSSLKYQHQYFCFPIYGLQCEDADDGNIGQFLFSDATILSGWQARQLNPNTNSNLQLALSDTQHYLIIRRPALEHYEEQNHHFDVVLQRAKEVLAGISLPLLAYSNFTSNPSLATEVYESSMNTMVHLHANGVTLRNEHVTALPIALPDYKFKRAELLDLLKREPYSWLTDVLLFTNPGNQLHRTVRRAASALYTGINQPTPTFQFFGCWVTLEVLLNYGVHKKIMSRAELLLGEQVYQDYSSGSLVTYDTASGKRKQRTVDMSIIRNRLVHDADTATMEHVFYIVRFAANALMACAYYSNEFETKNQLCEHLDYVSQVRSQPQGRDLFAIAAKWSALFSEQCLWDANFAHLVYFFGLYKLDTVEDEFLTHTATALSVLFEVRGYEPSIAYQKLANAMYTRRMPFPNHEKAWEYIALNRGKIDPALKWFS
ncbi:MAG: hypothetical protein IPI29_04155 [Ignavibacteria bacterium]|nr:hypothetical protein [Ignavibacteria bacterium]